MPQNWREILKTNFVNVDKLADFLELSEEMRQKISKKNRFPLLFPRRLAEKVKKGTLEDPILRQFLPTIEEEIESPEFNNDPLCDISFKRSNKMLQKYEARVLLVTTSACPLNCRFCFRQNFPYEKEVKDFEQELKIIREDLSIREVILSGGDPLSLSDKTLKDLLSAIDAVPHIERIRFHTRFPVAIPERIDDPFLQILGSLRAQLIFVLHCNHPLEFDEDVRGAMKKLKRQGALLLSHTVLLKGVNDDFETLKALFLSFVNHGVASYYLHQLDRIRGAAHFEVEEEKGKALIKQLNGVLPGYAVPKYVREIAGEPSKTPL